MNIDDLGRLLLQEGKPVDTGHWQSIKGVPQTKTVELTNAIFQLGLPHSAVALEDAVTPNLPWAELQFQERVGGVPLNPGETYKQWPWYRGNVATHQVVHHHMGLGGTEVVEAPEPKFSHTYMERFWPKDAGDLQYGGGGRSHGAGIGLGIRYRYGDLNDVIALLAREPYTRQAYLPIFFPEDTGAHHGERIPCTLGYHLFMREGFLHINYFIRSCDFLRHFRDDVYMAGRLCQWVLNELDHDLEVGQPDHGWENVVPGVLTMFMSSLHVFEGDLPKMRKLYA